jgi:hypothetical protein
MFQSECLPLFFVQSFDKENLFGKIFENRLKLTHLKVACFAKEVKSFKLIMSEANYQSTETKLETKF